MRIKEREFGTQEVIDEFIEEKRLSGITEKTVKEYAYFLHLFISADLRNWEVFVKDWQKKQTMKPVSLNHYLSILRTFTHWAAEKEYVKPYDVKLVKMQQPPLKMYSEEDIKKLIAPPKQTDDFTMWRSWAVICFIIGTGARIGTVCEIKNEDVSETSKIVLYRHLKNKQTTTLPISETLLKCLKSWRRRYSTGEWLFPCIDYSKLTYSAIKRGTEIYCKSRGVEYIGMHGFRHSFATMSVKNGMSTPVLMRYLTHSQISTTQRYVHLSVEDLRTSTCPLDNI